MSDEENQRYFVIKEPDGHLLISHIGADETQVICDFVNFNKKCVQIALELGQPSEKKLVHQTWEHYQAQGYSVVEVELLEIPDDPNVCPHCHMIWYNCLCSHGD